MLQFVKHESVVFVQRAVRRQFNSVPPSPNSIRRWYQQFQTKGCLCKGKSAGRPRVSEESVERVRQSFLRSPKKSNICKPLDCQAFFGLSRSRWTVKHSLDCQLFLVCQEVFGLSSILWSVQKFLDCQAFFGLSRSLWTAKHSLDCQEVFGLQIFFDCEEFFGLSSILWTVKYS